MKMTKTSIVHNCNFTLLSYKQIRHHCLHLLGPMLGGLNLAPEYCSAGFESPQIKKGGTMHYQNPIPDIWHLSAIITKQSLPSNFAICMEIDGFYRKYWEILGNTGKYWDNRTTRFIKIPILQVRDETFKIIRRYYV